MSELLLFSAGLDSFPAWYYLGRPPALYFDLGHRYAAQERAAITALSQRCGIEVTFSTELTLGDWEQDDAIIAMRNAHLAMLAANRADTIWCVGVRGDHTLDKSPEAFADISAFMTRLSGRPLTLNSPFWQMTKTQIVAWYLAQGLAAEDLLLTFSCSRDDGSPAHCGQCSSCLRRWISLINNGIDAPFEAPPWQWRRVQEYYLAAMRDGTYPEHRAAEFWAALDAVDARPPR
ncbi:7-cyano-7-deazaguanine synthase (plasmid) [Streptosporangium sp. NBC_01495]|uniref:7-cyano-7-deazaguanine synthase n=1 Tax=Streptosporangium sp. NBC_01495 TaxID=2903899 RepID=UPI002E355E87|nr:7-cyano-7-deazaguanine synthase [Streptosporangium sp. NBC_01495]